MSFQSDGHVYVWHKDTCALLEVLEGHEHVVNCVAWNPQEPGLFASASDDRTVRLWQSSSVAEGMSSASTAVSLHDSHLALNFQHQQWLEQTASGASSTALNEDNMDMVF